MKNFAKIFSYPLVIFALVFLLNACNQSKDTNIETSTNNPEFSGVWIVTDSNGNKFDITLNKDGTATSTWSVLDKGKWKVIDQKKAHIKWNNGANEFIIVDARGGAERRTFFPGNPIEGRPDTITHIKKSNP